MTNTISNYGRHQVKGRKNRAISKSTAILTIVVVVAVLVISTTVVLPNVYGTTPITSFTTTTSTREKSVHF